VLNSGDGYMARCPHHRDRTASLSVREGQEGRVMLHCHAGCPTVDVVESAGLSMVDLFAPGSRRRLQPRLWKGLVPMGPNGRPALECLGDDATAAMLGELARLARVRGRLEPPVAAAIKVVAKALGVDGERLTEAVRAALATDEPA